MLKLETMEVTSSRSQRRSRSYQMSYNFQPFEEQYSSDLIPVSELSRGKVRESRQLFYIASLLGGGQHGLANIVY